MKIRKVNIIPDQKIGRPKGVLKSKYYKYIKSALDGKLCKIHINSMHPNVCRSIINKLLANNDIKNIKSYTINNTLYISNLKHLQIMKDEKWKTAKYAKYIIRAINGETIKIYPKNNNILSIRNSIENIIDKKKFKNIACVIRGGILYILPKAHIEKIKHVRRHENIKYKKYIDRAVLGKLSKIPIDGKSKINILASLKTHIKNNKIKSIYISPKNKYIHLSNTPFQQTQNSKYHNSMWHEEIERVMNGEKIKITGKNLIEAYKIYSIKNYIRIKKLPINVRKDGNDIFMFKK